MKFVFLDFEASSLWKESYPIEVAWCDEFGEGESYLIKPEADWTIEGWDWNSQRMHGIPREHLFDVGNPAPEIALRVLELITNPDIHLVSDSPAFDRGWLRKLMQTANLMMPSLAILDFQVALGYACQPLIGRYPKDRVSQIALEITATAGSEQRGPDYISHRALPDARRLARHYRRTKQMVEQMVQATQKHGDNTQ